jgi:hypothetical protein
MAQLVILRAELRALRERIMGEFEDLQAVLAAANASLSAIAQDIQDIKNSIPTTGGLTAEQTASIRADVQALADRLASLDFENPATPPA